MIFSSGFRIFACSGGATLYIWRYVDGDVLERAEDVQLYWLRDDNRHCAVREPRL